MRPPSEPLRSVPPAKERTGVMRRPPNPAGRAGEFPVEMGEMREFAVQFGTAVRVVVSLANRHQAVLRFHFRRIDSPYNAGQRGVPYRRRVL